MTEKKSTFQELNAINVSDHIEKKMNLSYLSWVFGWQEMKKIDEEAEMTIHQFLDPELVMEIAKTQPLTPELLESLPKLDYKKDRQTGATVKVSVTIHGKTETEILPVMDYKNKAVANPDAMQINKAIKRCFVKALALHGLGLYIYAGEDLPQAEKDNQQEQNFDNNLKEIEKRIANIAQKKDSDPSTIYKWVINHVNENSQVKSDKINQSNIHLAIGAVKVLERRM